MGKSVGERARRKEWGRIKEKEWDRERERLMEWERERQENDSQIQAI